MKSIGLVTNFGSDASRRTAYPAHGPSKSSYGKLSITPRSGHWCFSRRGRQSHEQRTLAGALSYVYCPRDSVVLPLLLSLEA